jgi:hypothetical protein
MDLVVDLSCLFPFKELYRALINAPFKSNPSREISIITDAYDLAFRFSYLRVCREVGIQISLPSRMNHMGTIWIVSSSSSVPKLAMRVIERILSISDGVREGGLTS